jgi:polar amino acid transport system substrate-binding protein
MGIDEYLVQAETVIQSAVKGLRTMRNTKLWGIFFSIVILLLLVLSLFSCKGSKTTSEEGTKILRLAMSGAYRPLSMTDADGNLVGFDADIATEVAKRMGYDEPELVQTEWAGIQAGLQTEKYDLICGSMAITPARLEAMYFSLPYYISGAQVYVREGTESLDGIRMGVTESTTYEEYIETHPDEFPDCEILRYGSEAQIVNAMNTNKIDGFVSDRIVGGFYIKEGGAGDIVPHGGLLYNEHLGIAARKDSAGLVHKLNDALRAVVDDGTYYKIYEKWVGMEPDMELLTASWEEYAQYIPPLDERAE